QCAVAEPWRLSMNRDVAQVFQPAGLGDFPVARWNGGLESPPNPQSGKAALQASAGSWSRCGIIKSWRLSMNRSFCRQVLDCGDGVCEVTALAPATHKRTKLVTDTASSTQTRDSQASVA